MNRNSELALPTELPLGRAAAVYFWRALAFVLTFAPVCVLYVLALIIAQLGTLPSPKTTLLLAILTLAAVGGACYGIGSWINNNIHSMPPEVAFVVKPFVILAVVVGGVIAVPVFVVSGVFH